MTDDRHIVEIAFNDGEKLHFEVTPEEDAEWTRGTKIEKLLSTNCLVIEVEGNCFFYPTHNIRYIEIIPAPDPLPSIAIKGLKRMD